MGTRGVLFGSGNRGALHAWMDNINPWEMRGEKDETIGSARWQVMSRYRLYSQFHRYFTRSVCPWRARSGSMVKRNSTNSRNCAAASKWPPQLWQIYLAWNYLLGIFGRMPVIYRAKLKPGSEMVMQRYKNIYMCVLFFPIFVIDMSIFIHRCNFL